MDYLVRQMLIGVVVIILMVMSAFFSASETAYASLNVIRIKQLSKTNKKQSKQAKKVYAMAQDFTSTLSSILIGNNVVNLTASTLVTILFTSLFPNYGALVATIVITIIVIVFGEVMPKALAKNRAESFALNTINILEVVIYILKPITYWFSKLQKLLERNNVEQVSVTEDELIEIVQKIENEGVLEQTEREIIERAIEFDDSKVRDIMTLKEKVIFVYETASMNKVKEVLLDCNFSRIPVMNRASGEITGIIHQRDVFEAVVLNKRISVKKIMKKPKFISQRIHLVDALEKMQKDKSHMAIVTENTRNNTFVGIVTLEDIIEEIVGEIYDEHDELPEHVVEIGHHTYEVDANVSWREFLDEYSDETKIPRCKKRTFAELIEFLHGKVRNGEIIEYDNLVIKVTSVTKGMAVTIEIDVLTKTE